MKNFYDNDLCINSANAFYELGKQANELDIKANSEEILFKTDAFYAIPMVVNTTFACELYLKALLQKSNIEYVRTHNLFQLFKKLCSDQKLIITEEYDLRSNNSMTIEEVMKVHANGFEAWRYLFEKQNCDLQVYPPKSTFGSGSN